MARSLLRYKEVAAAAQCKAASFEHLSIRLQISGAKATNYAAFETMYQNVGIAKLIIDWMIESLRIWESKNLRI